MVVSVELSYVKKHPKTKRKFPNVTAKLMVMKTGQGRGKSHEKSSKEVAPCLNMLDMQCPQIHL